MTTPRGSVASCEPHDGLCWFYSPGKWGNGPHPLSVGFEKDVGRQPGKVTRHCLHRTAKPGCGAPCFLFSIVSMPAVGLPFTYSLLPFTSHFGCVPEGRLLRTVVSCPGNVFKLCHIVGWPVSSTLSLSVTFSPRSVRAVGSPTSPAPPLLQQSLRPGLLTCVKSGLTLMQQQSRPPGWCTLP